MFLYKFVFLAVFATVQCRYLELSNGFVPGFFVDVDYGDESNFGSRIPRQVQLQDFDAQPLLRFRRQVHGSMNTNPGGSSNVNVQVPLVGNERNVLSAVGSVEGANPGGSFAAAGGGLLLQNRDGHAASLTGRHIPGAGDQFTAAGKVNLLHTDNHNLDASVFVTRTQPKSPFIPDFNTRGGSLDYMYKDKIGGSLGMSHTDFFDKTDYSAAGKFNLFKSPTSSFDLSAGLSKSVSPYMPSSSWQPFGGATFTHRF